MKSKKSKVREKRCQNRGKRTTNKKPFENF